MNVRFRHFRPTPEGSLTLRRGGREYWDSHRTQVDRRIKRVVPKDTTSYNSGEYLVVAFLPGPRKKKEQTASELAKLVKVLETYCLEQFLCIDRFRLELDWWGNPAKWTFRVIQGSHYSFDPRFMPSEY